MSIDMSYRFILINVGYSYPTTSLWSVLHLKSYNNLQVILKRDKLILGYTYINPAKSHTVKLQTSYPVGYRLYILYHKLCKEAYAANIHYIYTQIIVMLNSLLKVSTCNQLHTKVYSYLQRVNRRG